MKQLIFLCSILSLFGCAKQEKVLDPPYVNITNKTQSDEEKRALFAEAKTLTFPLSEDDLEDVSIIEAKFDKEENMAGLAAPQIGIAKKIIIFSCPYDAEVKAGRPDLEQTMPKTIWINPSYIGIGPKNAIDYEGCFSSDGLVSYVPRFKKIKYSAYTPEGKHVTGIATGFLARIIQHETDHVWGIMCIDCANPGETYTVEEFRKVHKARLAKKVKHSK